NVVERVWTSTQSVDPQTAQLRYDTSVKEVPVEQANVHIGSDGKPKSPYSFTPKKAGIYKIYATSQDLSNHTVTISTYLYVFGLGYTGRADDANHLTIKANRASYNIGDTTTILIPSGVQGKALVSIERGSLLKAEVIDVPAGST